MTGLARRDGKYRFRREQVDEAVEHLARLVRPKPGQEGAVYFVDPHFKGESDTEVKVLTAILLGARGQSLNILCGRWEVSRRFNFPRSLIAQARIKSFTHADERGYPAIHDRYLLTPAGETIITNSVNGWEKDGVTFHSSPHEVYRTETEELWSSRRGCERKWHISLGGGSHGRPKPQEQVQGEEWMPEVAWRIVGASESPLKSTKLMQLINGVVSKQVPNNERDRTIGTISRWYETRDGRSVLTSDTKDEVDELVLRGAAQLLHKSQPGSNNDTLFWAIGAADPETAAEMILASWSSEQIDSLLEYATGVLKVLCENDNVIDPSDAVGFKVESGKAYVNPEYKQQRIKTFQRTEWHRPRMYYGVTRVVQLLMTVRPDRFANLVEKADHPTVQRWALFLVSRRSATGRLQALDWLKGEPSEPLIAIAIVHALECLRELGWEAEHPGRSQEEREEASATASRLLSGLVIQLAQYGPAESVRWTAELYKHGVLLTGINRREGYYNVGEELEELCVDSLVDLVRRNWSSDLREALRSGESWGDITNQTLPLGMVAHKVSGDYPDRATEIALIVLGKHAMHMNNLMANNDRAYYTLTENRAIKWMRGLGAALALALPESDTPLDWAVKQCSELPLSTWDADDLPEKFRLAGDVAQIQLSVRNVCGRSKVRSEPRRRPCNGKKLGCKGMGALPLS